MTLPPEEHDRGRSGLSGGPDRPPSRDDAGTAAQPGQARRFTLGADGPVTVTPGEVADLLEPMVRTWIAQCRTNGASAEAVAILDEWHRSLHATASAFRRSITDVGADVGELPDTRRRRVDPDVVQGLPVSVAAERLHLSPRTVTGLIGRGLTGSQVGGVWLIDPASVDTYAALRGAA